jgi:hypothetical protein
MVGTNWDGRIVLGVEDNPGRMFSPWSIGEVLAREPGAGARIRRCRHDSMGWLVGIGKLHVWELRDYWIGLQAF